MGVEILNKLLCEHCGINCDLVEVRIVKKLNVDDCNYVGRMWLCQPCLKKEIGSGDEEE